MKKVLTVIFMMSFASIIFAQRHGDRDRAIDTVSVSGAAIVEQTDSTHTKYYLDEDGDGVADYHLSFGPRWYTPDSSDAVRPEDGDIITILGGLLDSRRMDKQTILVFEINGEFWRDPYVSHWNNMGRHNHHRRDSHRGRRNHGFGWDHDSAATVSVSGTAIVDTTYYMDHYYLDTDSDGTPDYFLNFGPYWYQPESGAVRPEAGATVEIVGGELTTSMDVPMIIVYEINGELWRDSTSIGRHLGGGWLVGDMDSSRTFHSTFDRGDNITVHSGWNRREGHGGMGGEHLPDSLFCQMFETIPEDIPNRDGMNIFASYEINMFTSDGRNMMTDDRMMNQYLRFSNSIDYSFHYSDIQLETYDVDETTIKVKYWDEVDADWVTVDAIVDVELNTATFNSSDAINMIVLSASKVTGVDDGITALPTEFSLSQNYPNPFNPSTKIEYTLSNNAQVTLTIYNIVGEKVATLVNEYKNAGTYRVNFNASTLSSGVYFYEIKADAIRLVKKMSLLK